MAKKYNWKLRYADWTRTSITPLKTIQKIYDDSIFSSREWLSAYKTWLLVMLGMPSTGEVNIAGQASPSHKYIYPFMLPLHMESKNKTLQSKIVKYKPCAATNKYRSMNNFEIPPKHKTYININKQIFTARTYIQRNLYREFKPGPGIDILLDFTTLWSSQICIFVVKWKDRGC